MDRVDPNRRYAVALCALGPVLVVSGPDLPQRCFDAGLPTDGSHVGRVTNTVNQYFASMSGVVFGIVPAVTPNSKEGALCYDP